MTQAGGKPSPTIYEMSQWARVSIATVSRALSPETRYKVAPRTLSRIEALAARHGYTPSLAARQLSGARLKTIGIIFPQFAGVFATDYYVKILAGIADGLLDTEYQFKLLMLKTGQYLWEHHNFRAGEGVDGLIVTHWHTFFAAPRTLERLHVPCVVINDPEQGVKAHFVSGDHAAGGELAARHLYERGHRRVGVLTGPADSSDSALRAQGFRRFWRQSGSRYQLTYGCGEFQEERGYQAAREVLKQQPHITAFFCANDAMALGALRAAAEAGRTCPKDISIVGYDDIPAAASRHPGLTTIRVPLYELGRQAAGRLVAHLQDHSPDAALCGVTLLPVELVERASVRTHRKSGGA